MRTDQTETTMNITVKSRDYITQFMTVLTTEGLIYRTEISMLKTVHSKLFSDEIIKIRIFILQINNKIVDAAKALKNQKI